LRGELFECGEMDWALTSRLGSEIAIATAGFADTAILVTPRPSGTNTKTYCKRNGKVPPAPGNQTQLAYLVKFVALRTLQIAVEGTITKDVLSWARALE
jgi:hypothetical protein